MAKSKRLRRQSWIKSPWSKAHATDEASGLGRLKHLPAEIRTQIWQEILGHGLFHMTHDPESGVLRSYLCRTYNQVTTPWELAQCQYPLGPYGVARCFGRHPDPNFRYRIQNVPFHTLPLLRASRTICAEATEALYNSNVFGFDSLATLQSMLSKMKAHVRLIRSISIDFHVWKIWPQQSTQIFNVAFDDWTQMWALLVRHFTSLKHLRLTLHTRSSFSNLHTSDLGPLLKLRNMKSFHLTVWRYYHWGKVEDTSAALEFESTIRDNICGRLQNRDSRRFSE